MLSVFGFIIFRTELGFPRLPCGSGVIKLRHRIWEITSSLPPPSSFSPPRCIGLPLSLPSHSLFVCSLLTLPLSVSHAHMHMYKFRNIHVEEEASVQVRMHWWKVRLVKHAEIVELELKLKADYRTGALVWDFLQSVMVDSRDFTEALVTVRVMYARLMETQQLNYSTNAEVPILLFAVYRVERSNFQCKFVSINCLRSRWFC